MYNVEGKLGFIGHPRTASRSVATALQTSGLNVKRVKHHHLICEEECYDIFKEGGIVICVVRNMFDILVSWYYNIPECEQKPAFEDFVNKLITDPTQRWFRPRLYHYGLGYCNHLIRYENIQEDFDHCLDLVGLPSIGLPLVGESLSRRHYRKYYNDDLRWRVEDRWADDLAITGHTF